MALKPFCVRITIVDDIEICYCKKHLFFKFLTKSCEKESSTYLFWKCTPNEKVLVSNQMGRFETVPY